MLTGIHDFSGTLKKTFKITPYDAGSGESSGLAVQQNIRIAYAKGGAQPMPRVMCGNTTLVYGRDYTLKYTNNRTVNDGTNPKKRPTMTVTAKGNYKGKQTAYFTIAPQDIGSLSITAADKVASTKPNKYQSTPKAVDIDGKALAKGTDYEKVVQYTYAERTELADGTIREKDANVEATDIQKVGTRINVTVTGRNNYVGTLTGEYRIIKADIAKAKVVIPPQEFTGNAVRPDKSRITITIGKDTIPADSYEIIGYSNNVKKGTATIILQGTKEYGGIRKATFKIQSKGLAWWEKK